MKVFFFTPIFNFQYENIRKNHQMVVDTSQHDVMYFNIVGASVEHSKQIAYRKFLETDFDYFFNVDADIFFFPGENPIDKLISYEKEIIAGIYTLKVPPYRPSHRPLDLQQMYERDGKFPNNYVFNIPNELHEIMFSAGGCMMIHRSVIEKLTDKYKVPNLPTIYKDEYLSEDFSFCLRAREFGYKIYALPQIKLGHAGQYLFTLEDYKKHI